MSSTEPTAELIRIVQTKGEDRLRADAIGKLSLRYLKTGNIEVSKAFADIVANESESRDLRIWAYINLYEVSTRSYAEYPSLDVFSFPRDVDWDFVELFGGWKKESQEMGEESA